MAGETKVNFRFVSLGCQFAVDQEETSAVHQRNAVFHLFVMNRKMIARLKPVCLPVSQLSNLIVTIVDLFADFSAPLLQKL